MNSTLLSPADARSKATSSNKPSRSLVEDVVNQVTRQIVSGELVPGVKLPTEQQMMQGLGVSRTVVREAISHLQAAGLVETRHGVGTFVLGVKQPPKHMVGSSIVTIYDILDMLEFRICLEPQAAGLAAVKRSEEDLEAFSIILKTFVDEVYSGGVAIQPDLDFHFLIGKCSGNRYFEEVYRFIGNNTIPRTRIKISQYTTYSQEELLMRNHSEHQAVFDAIARQDPESAQAAMRIHLANSRERFHKALESEERQKAH